MSGPAQAWVSRLTPYKFPDNGRAVFEIAVTLIPFVSLWVGAWALLQVNLFLAMLLVVPAAGLMVRVFIIQHDCGHGSMFTSRFANEWVGRVLGVITLTPFDYWRFSHARHHAGSGNLDRRGIGDIDTLTVAEYQALNWRGRLRYRVYRHPLVMFGLGPAYLFVFSHRLPLDALKYGRAPQISVLGTNLGIVMVYGILIYLVGLKDFLIIQTPVVIIGASIGVWLFYVQHQFEETHWEKTPDWSHANASLHGSSYYALPKPLMWITGNIGIHHVHHLSSRVPFHKLPQVLKDYPELSQIGRLTIWESIKCVPLTLWDEETKRLISFRSLHRKMATT